ncbi:MAG: diaminopimelate epimerase [Psychromonas sp.]|jgi:diaminopimelate epimerase
MKIDFYKYQGTGNDFVMLDNTGGDYDNLSIDQVRLCCDRKYGVGADGLIKINALEGFDFEVEYFNADGTKSFCGNGARCSVKFVNDHILKKDSYSFTAIDGEHTAQISGEEVNLEMRSVSEVEVTSKDIYIIDTGSPHFLQFSKDIDNIDMYDFGHRVRYSPDFEEDGINVNLLEEITPRSFKIRTYERGVEDETLSCGTGITAAAIAFAVKNDLFDSQEFSIKSLGGDLTVKLNRQSQNQFIELRLIGAAKKVFKGIIHV